MNGDNINEKLGLTGARGPIGNPGISPEVPKIIEALDEFEILSKIKKVYEKIDDTSRSKLVLHKILENSDAEFLSPLKATDNRSVASYVVENGNFMGDVIRELTPFASQSKPITEFLAECQNFWKENELKFIVESNIIGILDINKPIYEGAIEALRKSSFSDSLEYSLVENLKPVTWIPQINVLFEKCKTLTGNLLEESQQFNVSKIYSYTQKTKDGLVFESLGDYLEFKNGELSKFEGEINQDFKKRQDLLKTCIVEESKISYPVTSTVSIDIEKINESFEISVAGKKVEFSDIKDHIARTNAVGLREAEKIRSFETVAESFDEVAHIDFGYTIFNKYSKPLSSAIYKIGESVYIHMKNSHMGTNILEKVSAETAISKFKEVMKYDVSEFVKDVLEKENSLKDEDRKAQIEVLEKEINDLVNTRDGIENQAKELEIDNISKISKARNFVQEKIDAKHQDLSKLLKENEEYVDGVLTTLIKGFKKGSFVQVNSLDYSSMGSGDKIKVILPNNEIVSILKKQVKVNI